jgi:hypothetical protein
VLVCGYGLLVAAAGARSVVQLATHGDRARLAYALSGVAAGVYLVGLILVRRVDGGEQAGGGRRSRSSGVRWNWSA